MLNPEYHRIYQYMPFFCKLATSVVGVPAYALRHMIDIWVNVPPHFKLKVVYKIGGTLFSQAYGNCNITCYHTGPWNRWQRRNKHSGNSVWQWAWWKSCCSTLFRLFLLSMWNMLERPQEAGVHPRPQHCFIGGDQTVRQANWCKELAEGAILQGSWRWSAEAVLQDMQESDLSRLCSCETPRPWLYIHSRDPSRSSTAIRSFNQGSPGQRSWI